MNNKGEHAESDILLSLLKIQLKVKNSIYNFHLWNHNNRSASQEAPKSTSTSTIKLHIYHQIMTRFKTIVEPVIVVLTYLVMESFLILHYILTRLNTDLYKIDNYDIKYII